MKLILQINLFFILINILALLLAIIGKFSLITLSASILISSLFCLYFLRKIKTSTLNKSYFLPITIIIIYIIFIFLFNHETYFGGRDNGVYANSALMISNTGSYKISDVLVGSFPGFEKSTGSLYQPAFYLGYISWLSIFITLFGYRSIVFANSILLFFGLTNLYFILKKIVKIDAILPLLVTITTFPFLWFTRSTYSENISFMLFMFIVNSIFKNEISYVMIASTLLMCVRIESILLIAILIPYLIIQVRRRVITLHLQHYLLLILCLMITFFYYVQVDKHYLPQLITLTTNIISNFLNKKTISSSNLSTSNAIKLGSDALEYHIPKVTNFLLMKYNLLYFIFFIPSLTLAIRKWKTSLRSKKLILLIILIVPQLFYLLNPMITLDQPWFLRRFFPFILPFGVCLFYYFISEIMTPKLITVITFLMIIINLIISAPIITFTENKGMYDQLNSFTDLPINKSNSIVFVDYSYTGPFKLAEPLSFIYKYSTSAITLQSLSDFQSGDTKNSLSLYSEGSFAIPHSVCTFSNVYLLSTPQSLYNQFFFDQNMEQVWTKRFTYKQLHRECEIFRLTPNQLFHQMAHLETDDVLNFCNQLPHEINTINVDLVLYKIDKRKSDDFFHCIEN